MFFRPERPDRNEMRKETANELAIAAYGLFGFEATERAVRVMSDFAIAAAAIDPWTLATIGSTRVMASTRAKSASIANSFIFNF
mgnify:CR=1 FL=1